MTTGEQIIGFVESLPIPEGAHVGQPMKLEPFQKQFILDVYDNPHGTYTGILSMGRKNGKTALIAALLLAHLVGPVAQVNSQIVSGAMSREQAAIVFNLSCKIINLTPELQAVTRIVPSSKRLYGLPLNVEFRALAADGATAQGLSPVLVIFDEAGQIQGPTNAFFDALVTAQGAHEQPLFLTISTQAANDADLLSVMIDDAKKGHDPHTVCHVYEAPADCDLADKSAWQAANPALGVFRSLEDMQRLADRALRLPSFANAFRNLNLNQRISAEAAFISKETWLESLADFDDTPFLKGTVWAGLDLSAKTDLTAFAMLALYNGQYFARVEVFTPADTLHDRALLDKAPYDVWKTQGHLTALPGKVVDYAAVAARIVALNERFQFRHIAFDRWRIESLKRELELLDAPALPWVDWGQGFKDATVGIEALESLILNGKFRHDGNPLLNMAIAGARVVSDAALNRKFEKRKSTARIDALVALAMAAGIASREPEPKQPSYQIFMLN